MLEFTNEFERATGITESYDPDSDKESGLLSTAWWEKYSEFLELELKTAKQMESLLCNLARCRNRNIKCTVCTRADIRLADYYRE